MSVIEDLANRHHSANREVELAQWNAFDAQQQLVDYLERESEALNDDEQARSTRMKELKASYFRVALADVILSDQTLGKLPFAKRLQIADEIIAKKARSRQTKNSIEYRTVAEHKMFNAVRSRWQRLMDYCDIPPWDKRGGPRI